MKKGLLMVLGIVSIALLSLGGSLAALTSRDAGNNTFTFGDVEIELVSDLGNGPTMLMPDNENKTYANYKITNTGENDAYVFLRVKVPAVLEDAYPEAADNVIHWNFEEALWHRSAKPTQKAIDTAISRNYLPEGTTVENFDQGATWLVTEGIKGMTTETIKVDGVDVVFNVYDIMYNKTIAKDETTNVGVTTVYLDNRLDKVGDKYYLVKGGEKVRDVEFDFARSASFIVEGHAIQAQGFATPDAAYKAYMAQGSDVLENTLANTAEAA